MRHVLICLFVIVMFTSCDQSAKQKEAQQEIQQLRDDSIANTVRESMQQDEKRKDDSIANTVRESMQQDEKRKEDSIATAIEQNKLAQEQLQGNISNIKSNLETAKADMVVAYDEMRRIQEFHFGRTSTERDEQIRNQTIKIQELRDRVTELTNQLNSYENQVNSQ